MVPVQDFVGPVEDGVHGVVVLGNLAGFVEVGEALKSVQGALEIVGLIEAVELLESVPSHPKTRMSSEQPVEAFPVRGGEMVVSFQQTKPGAEQVRFAGPVSHRAVGGVAVPGVPGSVLPVNHRTAWNRSRT